MMLQLHHAEHRRRSVQLTTFLGTRRRRCGVAARTANGASQSHLRENTYICTYMRINVSVHVRGVRLTTIRDLLPRVNHTASTFRRRCSRVERNVSPRISTSVIMKVLPRITTICTVIDLPEQIIGETKRDCRAAMVRRNK